jgi:hypothetical protein
MDARASRSVEDFLAEAAVWKVSLSKHAYLRCE